MGTPAPRDCELYYVDRDALFSYHKLSEAFLQRVSHTLQHPMQHIIRRSTLHFAQCTVLAKCITMYCDTCLPDALYKHTVCAVRSASRLQPLQSL
jgi:hypothetical protein